MTENQIAEKLTVSAHEMAKAIKQGKDIMITTSASGLSIKKLTVSRL